VLKSLVLKSLAGRKIEVPQRTLFRNCRVGIAGSREAQVAISGPILLEDI
jgi:hypothetical protein